MPEVLAFGMYWMYDEHSVNNARLQKISKDIGKSAFCIHPLNERQYGFCSDKILKGQTYSAAMVAAISHDNSTAIIVEKLSGTNLYWLVAIDKGSIIPDTDSVYSTSEDCLSKLELLRKYLNEPKVFAHPDLGIPDTSSFVWPQTLPLSLEPISSIRSSTEILLDRFNSPKAKLILGASIASTLIFAATNYYASIQEEEERRYRIERAKSQKEKNEISLELRRESARRRLLTPWLDTPPANIFAEGCIIHGFNALEYIPEWELSYFACEPNQITFRYIRENTGFVRNARIAFEQKYQSTYSDDYKTANFTLPLTWPDYSNLRVDETPLSEHDAKAFILDLFQPFGSQVSISKPEKQPNADEARTLGLTAAVALNFTVVTEYQPEQWVGILKRIPTIILHKMEVQDFKKMSWKVTGSFHVDGVEE